MGVFFCGGVAGARVFACVEPRRAGCKKGTSKRVSFLCSEHEWWRRFLDVQSLCMRQSSLEAGAPSSRVLPSPRQAIQHHKSSHSLLDLCVNSDHYSHRNTAAHSRTHTETSRARRAVCLPRTRLSQPQPALIAGVHAHLSRLTRAPLHREAPPRSLQERKDGAWRGERAESESRERGRRHRSWAHEQVVLRLLAMHARWCWGASAAARRGGGT